MIKLKFDDPSIISSIITEQIPITTTEDLFQVKIKAEQLVFEKIKQLFRTSPISLLNKIDISVDCIKINSLNVITQIKITGPSYIVSHFK